MPAVRFVVRGSVQGVGFRWFVFQEAERLGLCGWVSNRPDGAVEVVADGALPALAQLEAALARGPAYARVSHVEKSEVPHEVGQHNSFDIR